MLVIINGVETELADTVTVANLLKQLELTGRIAVELNKQIVPRSEFESRLINNGDMIEIVHAIGGGQSTFNW
ncbi:MAG: thiamine biosynthesis protein ThiS [Gammaproteobacteria bacterium RIFCSPLOWO2_12_FULL_52_10]|nr:MAG: thiamine biosynthesis protein ThiS [Gammaproteobacteria bacterium RIFCSPLOWO2_12_FULL_52_10]